MKARAYYGGKFWSVPLDPVDALVTDMFVTAVPVVVALACEPDAPGGLAALLATGWLYE